MRKIVFLILTLFGQFVSAQCTGVESYTISPVSNSYPGGSNIQVCYTMQGWNMLSSNWVEGFQISTSQGLSNLTPIGPPNDCNSDQNVKYRVELTRTAQRELRRIPNPFHDVIVQKLKGLENDPRPPGCKRLVGEKSSDLEPPPLYKTEFRAKGEKRNEKLNKIL